MDNLNTHKEASIYEAFPPAKARDPKHRNWHQMAAIEIGLLVCGCLDRLSGTEKEFRSEIIAYLDRQNENPRPIIWQFTNDKARIKFKALSSAV